MNKVDIELVVEVDNDSRNELKLDDIKKLEVFVNKSEENMNIEETKYFNLNMEKQLSNQCKKCMKVFSI